MIRKVIFNRQLKKFIKYIESGKSEVEARMLYENYLAYGLKYNFCNFYKTKDCVLSKIYGSCILHGENADFEELADFLDHRVREIVCSCKTAEELSKYLAAWTLNNVNLMKFGGSGVYCDTEKEVPFEEFFEIIKTAADLNYELWYLEMSHRLRHNISQMRRLNKSVLIIRHNIFGSAFLSHVATSPEYRGRGDATRLILSVCSELAPNEVFLFCEDGMLDFYKRIGFEFICKKSILKC